ncbi:MAG: hypothetical protein IPK32_14000 [Verrucomicrobiaceae bacterium]|nr:hypothetical protein [Verrucomicrobiaceae bacterium]
MISSKFASFGEGGGSFATLPGSPSDNAALAAALAAKLDKAGGMMTGPLAIAAGTLSTQGMRLTQTWNAPGVSCRAFEVAVTDTSSAIASEFFGIYAGAAGATKVFSVGKVGGANVVECPSLRSTSNTWSLDFGVVGFGLGSARRVQWSSTVNYYDAADLSLERAAANVSGVKGLNSTTGAAIEICEMTAPSAPPANGARLYVEDNGSGKTRLMVRFASGASQQIAIEP